MAQERGDVSCSTSDGAAKALHPWCSGQPCVVRVTLNVKSKLALGLVMTF